MKKTPINKWNSNNTSMVKGKVEQEKKRTKSESTQAGTTGSSKVIAAHIKKANGVDETSKFNE